MRVSLTSMADWFTPVKNFSDMPSCHEGTMRAWRLEKLALSNFADSSSSTKRTASDAFSFSKVKLQCLGYGTVHIAIAVLV